MFNAKGGGRDDDLACRDKCTNERNQLVCIDDCSYSEDIAEVMSSCNNVLLDLRSDAGHAAIVLLPKSVRLRLDQGCDNCWRWW